MTATCDLNVDWNKCPNCARFKERIKDAEEASRAASANLDRAYAEYREDVAAGRACIATPRQRAWSSYLDDLQMEQSLASTRCTEAINAWATSIHRHHRLHEARQQEAEDSSKDVAAETEEMVTISKAEAVDELVNIYGGHIDKWLEALRERGSTHTDAGDDTEAAETEGETARELFGELRYGDVPDFDLPDDFEDGSWVSLRSASVAVRVYMILLERYAPRAAKGYPAWVANRLRDVLDEAAIQRAITDQEGWK